MPKSGQKPGVLFSGELDHAQFRDHDRPAKDRDDGEERQDNFPRDRRVLEREKQTACCNQLRNQHPRFTCLSNTGFW
ncbi:MAG: hypothetical protein DMF25_07900 [Verrucomicrobia bacterium]|nr:MAG: hypothetical protein DMF25_07900 [Verrucomicrobiota bacterium]